MGGGTIAPFTLSGWKQNNVLLYGGDKTTNVNGKDQSKY
jgi:hypothetical protein